MFGRRLPVGFARCSGGALALIGLLACPAPDSPPAAPDSPPPEASRPSEGTLWSGRDAAPLVIVISLDTLRADHLGIYGYDRPTSPTLDGFGSEGVVFEDATSTAPWTLPSHASLLTGMYPNRHGVVTVTSVLPPGTPTLARMLGSAGFTTAAVVNSGWLVNDRYALTKDFQKFRWVIEVPDRRSPGTWITDQAIAWLEERDPGEAMFLFVHYYDVHSDYASLPAYEKLFVRPYDGPATGTARELNDANAEPSYDAWCLENLDSLDEDYCQEQREARKLPPEERTAPLVYDDRDIAHLIDLYDASIRQLDSEIGRLFGYLRGKGLMDDALIFVIADHGEEFGEHGGTHHTRTQYQEVLRVPVLVRGPGIPPGRRVGTPISLVDIAPTILSATGVPASVPLDGLDLRPLWSGAEASDFAERPIFGETGYANASAHRIEELKDTAPITRAVRLGSFKLYYDNRKDPKYALYDLARDPGETVDVSAEHPDLAATLERLLEARYRHGASATAAPTLDLSPDEADRLRSLGYVN